MGFAPGDRVRLARPEWPNAFHKGQVGQVEKVEDDADLDMPPVNPREGRIRVLYVVTFPDGIRGFHAAKELESA